MPSGRSRGGGQSSIWLNAANEAAVQAFLGGRIAFPGIARVQESLLEKAPARSPQSLNEIQASSRKAREMAEELIGQIVSRQEAVPIS